MFGQLAAQLDEDERVERSEKRRRCRQEIKFGTRLDENLRVATDAIKAFTEAVLLCNGYHTHKGQWRKIRG